MAEGAPLLRVYTLIAYRGFESLLLRQKIIPRIADTGDFFLRRKTAENPNRFDKTRMRFGRQRRSAGLDLSLQAETYH